MKLHKNNEHVDNDIIQAGRPLDSAPSANVVAMATKIGPLLVSPARPLSGLSGIQTDLWAILSKNSPNLPKFRCHGNKGRLRNILYGSIESAIPENPLLGAKISGLFAIQAELGDFFAKFGGVNFGG